jgi:hypothetical protein
MMTLHLPKWEHWHLVAEDLVRLCVDKLEETAFEEFERDTVDTILECIWAAAKSLTGEFFLNSKEISIFKYIYTKFPAEEIQAKVIGILCLAAQDKVVDTNEYITKILMREIKFNLR